MNEHGDPVTLDSLTMSIVEQGMRHLADDTLIHITREATVTLDKTDYQDIKPIVMLMRELCRRLEQRPEPNA